MKAAEVVGLIFFLVVHPLFLRAQPLDEQLGAIQEQLEQVDKQRNDLLVKQENIRLEQLRQMLLSVGYPVGSPGTVVEHEAMSLCYAEAHEQPSWVMHVIMPDIVKGAVGRTNDFRPDPKVTSGSAEEKDYFIKTLKPDSSGYVYDGFGFDRGHLAPSADFKWSRTALSESYYYSNMSPQRPEFNRGAWSVLEANLRNYVFETVEPLYVVTGPILRGDLPIIPRSVNKVTVPEEYYKVVLDYSGNEHRAIAFIMPNIECPLPLEAYAVPIDKVEELTGINFFPKLPEAEQAELEQQKKPMLWFGKNTNDVLPLHFPEISAGYQNTHQVLAEMNGSGFNENKKRTVCGTVVSVYTSRKGTVLINLDKAFPNSIFTATIFSKNVINFSFDPMELKYKKVCLTGNVNKYRDMPSLILNNEKQIEWLED